MSKIISSFSLCALILLIAVGTPSQDLGSAWKRVIKNCGKSQIVGRDVLFFGPSNTIGLGSVWRRTSTGGYNPRFELSDLFPNEETRKRIIKFGEVIKECEGTKGEKWNLKVGLPFVGKILGNTGVETELRKARQATVTVDKVALDVIKELPFQQEVDTLRSKDPENAYVADMLIPERLLIIKGYRISGLRVQLDYDPRLLEELKGKYPEGGSVRIGGEKGLDIEFNYSGDSRLTVKLNGEVYIAGEFSRLLHGQISSATTPSSGTRLRFEPVQINPKGVTVDPIQTFRKPR